MIVILVRRSWNYFAVIIYIVIHSGARSQCLTGGGHKGHGTVSHPGGLTFSGGQLQQSAWVGHLIQRTPIQPGGLTAGGGQVQHPGGIAATDTVKMARIAAKIAKKFILRFLFNWTRTYILNNWWYPVQDTCIYTVSDILEFTRAIIQLKQSNIRWITNIQIIAKSIFSALE